MEFAFRSRPHPYRICAILQITFPIPMSHSSTRLGALAGQWDVPVPDDLKARLQPEPEVAQRFYESSLLASASEPSEGQPTSENGSGKRGRTLGAEFEIYLDEEGGFRWRLRAEGGSVLANSGRPYPSRTACRRAINQVRDLSPEARVTEQS